MPRLSFILSAALISILVVVACSDNDLDVPQTGRFTEPQMPTQPYAYANLPEEALLNQSPDNPITDEGAALGRVLFYDVALSHNNSVACASCHHQDKAFADPGTFSTGFRSGATKRNSPSIQNVGTMKSFFWDNRATQLEEQVIMPIQDHIEMGIADMGTLVEKLNEIDYYKELFADAFGDEEVTEERIASGLAQFLRSIYSRDNKWNRSQEGLDESVFNGLEVEGLHIFQAHCQGCHDGKDLGGNGEDANIGLEMSYSDNGSRSDDTLGSLNGWFKIPSLRNIALTAPYMHDGRFATLDDVINHYNSGVQDHPDLSRELRDIPISRGGSWGGGPTIISQDELKEFPVVKMKLSDFDKRALKAFLESLNDEGITTPPKYSNPFL